MLPSSRHLKGLTAALCFFFFFLLARSSKPRNSNHHNHATTLRVGYPLVVILVHPSPKLDKETNFRLKQAIARTWAKDVEQHEYGTRVYFVGEHDNNVIMREPNEFRRGGSAKHARRPGKSRDRMLIPTVYDNGKSDDAPGLVKSLHWIYNNTDWHLGPMFQNYPYILNTDTTNYINVENLVQTLLSIKHNKLLTMAVDSTFTGSMSEAQQCRFDQDGDELLQLLDDSSPEMNDDNSVEDEEGEEVMDGDDDGRKVIKSIQDTKAWFLSDTQLFAKPLFSVIGPHLHSCMKSGALTSSSAVISSSSSSSSSSAVSSVVSNLSVGARGLLRNSQVQFAKCVMDWAFSPLFYEKRFCGKFATLPLEERNKIMEEGLAAELRALEGTSGSSQQQAPLVGKEGDLGSSTSYRKKQQQLAESQKDFVGLQLPLWVVGTGFEDPDQIYTMYRGLSGVADDDEEDEEPEELEYEEDD